MGEVKIAVAGGRVGEADSAVVDVQVFAGKWADGKELLGAAGGVGEHDVAQVVGGVALHAREGAGHTPSPALIIGVFLLDSSEIDSPL